jgi:branched-chain amino acid transport system substrate-binding protein
MVVVLAAVFTGLPLVCGPAWAQAKQPIKLGSSLGLTGPHAMEAQDQQFGVQMVVDDYNKKGGILGRKIDFIVRDDKLNAGEAALKAKELVEKEKVDLLIGTSAAHTLLALMQEAKKHNIPIMGINNTNDMNKLPDWGPYMFHEGYTPYMLAQCTGQFILNNLGKKWYFLMGTWAYATQVYDSFQKFMAKYGGENLGKSDYQLGTSEFSAYFPKILDAKPDVLITTAFGKDYVNFVKQATDFGLKSKMKILFCLTDLVMAKEAGQANIAGTYGGLHFYWELQDTMPQAKAFVQDFSTRFKRPPSGYAGYAYSATKELLWAIEKAGAIDPQKIRTLLEGRVYDHYKGKQWWRKCDHQAFQDWYIVKGREPKDVKKEWGFFEIAGKTTADEKWERTCEELGFK